MTSHGSTLDRRVYQLVPHPPVSERILASKAISVNDRGQAYLQLYCQGLESLGIHQTINSRLANMESGPAYATWLFGFEHFNGVLVLGGRQPQWTRR